MERDTCGPKKKRWDRLTANTKCKLVLLHLHSKYQHGSTLSKVTPATEITNRRSCRFPWVISLVQTPGSDRRAFLEGEPQEAVRKRRKGKRGSNAEENNDRWNLSYTVFTQIEDHHHFPSRKKFALVERDPEGNTYSAVTKAQIDVSHKKAAVCDQNSSPERVWRGTLIGAWW